MENFDKSKEYIDVSAWIKAGLKYWYVFVIAVGLSLCLGAFYYLTAKRTYLVTANLLIEEEDNPLGGGIQSALMNSFSLGSMLGGSKSINDEIFLIGSFSNFREVVKKNGLNIDYKENKLIGGDEFYKNSPLVLKSIPDVADTLNTVLVFKVNIDENNKVKVKANKKYNGKKTYTFDKLPALISTAYGAFVLDTTGYFKPGEALKMKIVYSGYNRAAELLQEEVLVDIASKKASVINLSTKMKNRQKGMDILNNIIATYNSDGIVRKNSVAEGIGSFLDERISLIAKDLDEIEKTIEHYKKENSLTDIEAEAKIILEKGSDFKEKLIEVDAQFTMMELVEDFLMLPENKYSLVPLNIGLNDKTVLEGLQKYNDALLERMRLVKTTNEINPVVEVFNEQINAMRDNMLSTIRSLKSWFSHTRDNLITQEEYFDARIKGMPTQEREFISIKRQQLIKQELFVFLLQKQEENALTMAMSTPKSQVIDKAYSLFKPVSPKLSVVGVFSIIMGLCLAFGFIFLKEYVLRRN